MSWAKTTIHNVHKSTDRRIPAHSVAFNRQRQESTQTDHNELHAHCRWKDSDLTAPLCSSTVPLVCVSQAVMNYASHQFYNPNRGEEYSHQTAWYPDEYSNEGARSRLDSGSFSNSSSDSTNEKKKRRSHRPRGCRGGGARRARKALREQARANQALQENVKPSDYAHTSGLHAKSKEFRYPPKYVTEESDGMFKESRISYRAPPSPAPSLQPCMSTLSNDSSSSFTTNDLLSIFLPASNQFVDSQGRPRNRVPYGTMTYTDSQRKINALASAGVTLTNPNPTYQTAEQSYRASGGVVNVLPPLPLDSMEEEPETFVGPNPYALKSNLRPELESYAKPNRHPDADSYEAQSASSNENEERIEKQRNMLSGGGSLFVTSPRSFLTGRKPTIF